MKRSAALQRWCREIFRYGLKQLARDSGVPHDLIWRTLRNPAICGYPARRHQVTYTDQGERRVIRLPRREWRWPEQPGRYPAACTRPEWEAIQQVLEARSTLRGKSGFEARGWCRNIIRFQGYPHPVRLGCIWRGVETYEIDPDRTDRHIYIRRDVVHPAVENALLRLVECPESVVRSLERQTAVPDPAGPENGSQRVLAGIRAELESERRRLVQLLQRWAGADEETARALREAEEATKRNIQRLKKDLAAAEQAPARDLMLESLLPILPEILTDWHDLWPALPGDLKQRVAEAFIAAVEVRCAPVEGRKRLQREVLAVRYPDWLVLP